jgi:hypothetical protein
MLDDSWFLLRDTTVYNRVLIRGPADAYRVVRDGVATPTSHPMRIDRAGRPLGLTLEAPPAVATRLAGAHQQAPDPTHIPVVLEAWTEADDPAAPVGAFIYLDFGAGNVEPTRVPTAEGPRFLTLIGRAVRLAVARRHPGALEDEATDMLSRLLTHGPMTVPDQLLAHLDGEPPWRD